MELPICEFKENFLFRKRLHQLYPFEIRTIQDDFFTTRIQVTRLADLGTLLQYQSEVKLFELLTAIAFLLLGMKGYTCSSTDELLFLIATCFTFAGVYWILNVLFKAKYVGSFYFSDFGVKEGTFEIKSRYPPTKELEEFLQALKLRKKAIAIEDQVHAITTDWTAFDIQEQLTYLQRTYNLNEVESQALKEQLQAKFNSLKNKNSGTAPDSSGN